MVTRWDELYSQYLKEYRTEINSGKVDKDLDLNSILKADHEKSDYFTGIVQENEQRQVKWSALSDEKIEPLLESLYSVLSLYNEEDTNTIEKFSNRFNACHFTTFLDTIYMNREYLAAKQVINGFYLGKLREWENSSSPLHHDIIVKANEHFDTLWKSPKDKVSDLNRALMIYIWQRVKCRGWVSTLLLEKFRLIVIKTEYRVKRNNPRERNPKAVLDLLPPSMSYADSWIEPFSHLFDETRVVMFNEPGSYVDKLNQVLRNTQNAITPKPILPVSAEFAEEQKLITRFEKADDLFNEIKWIHHAFQTTVSLKLKSILVNKNAHVYSYQVVRLDEQQNRKDNIVTEDIYDLFSINEETTVIVRMDDMYRNYRFLTPIQFFDDIGRVDRNTTLIFIYQHQVQFSKR